MRIVTTSPSTCPATSSYTICSCNRIQTGLSRWSWKSVRILSRPASVWRMRGMNKVKNAQLKHSAHCIVKDLDCRLLDHDSWPERITTQSVNFGDGMQYLPSMKRRSEGEPFSDKRMHVLDTSYSNLLKLALLLGSTSLLAAEPAFASSVNAIELPSIIDFFGDLGDISTGFASAFLLIFFSELGDKTFFIAALLAARSSAPVVFAGTFGALAVMTVISVVLGRAFHYVDGVLPFRFGETDLPIDDIAAVILLIYFGVSTLIDANSSDGTKGEDEQKEAELAVSEFSGNGAGILSSASTVISTFALVFVAEWGDKSFFSTIALAAASSPLGVISGSLAGHGVATLIAVLGGSLLGTFLSEKTIAYTGGVLFLVFAGLTLLEIING